MISWPELPDFWAAASAARIERWKLMYPGVNVDAEVGKMAEWLWANPKRRPRNYPRFCVNWLAKAHTRNEQLEYREAMRRAYDNRDAMAGKLR